MASNFVLVFPSMWRGGAGYRPLKCTLAAAWLLCACGRTRGNPASDPSSDSANDGDSGSSTGGDASSDGASSETTTASSTGIVSGGGAGGTDGQASCDDAWRGYDGCASAAKCEEPVDDFGASAVSALCLPDLGVWPVSGPCPVRGFSGRCLLESDGYWVYSYDDPNAAEQCEGAGRTFCRNPSGISAAQMRACESACQEARPDFSAAPECEAILDCPAQCAEALRGLAPACARCVLATITWPASYCFEFECRCEEPKFAATDSFECELQCDPDLGFFCAAQGGGECDGYATEFPFLPEVNDGCEWQLLPPAPGDVIDLERVNVSVSFDCETTQALSFVENVDNCTDQSGWYYSDLATGSFALCPQTCDALQARGRGSIGLLYGCHPKLN